jgi:hypothetical protein
MQAEGNSMSVQAINTEAASEVRAEWIQALEQLTEQIQEWTTEKGWSVTIQPRPFFEEILGAYSVPDALIKTPQGQLSLEIKGRGLPEGAGRAELSAWPSLYRVLLLHRTGQPGWTIRTDSGISLHQPWNKETFLTLAEDLLSAE